MCASTRGAGIIAIRAESLLVPVIILSQFLLFSFKLFKEMYFNGGKLILRPFLELVISVSPSSRTSILNSPSGVW